RTPVRGVLPPGAGRGGRPATGRRLDRGGEGAPAGAGRGPARGDRARAAIPRGARPSGTPPPRPTGPPGTRRGHRGGDGGSGARRRRPRPGDPRRPGPRPVGARPGGPGARGDGGPGSVAPLRPATRPAVADATLPPVRLEPPGRRVDRPAGPRGTGPAPRPLGARRHPP